ncbi:MAG: serine/threonine protein kinase [Polyangiaceae bacterium]|nr:serine/threonine protein kinase [Polyangiaceae bacterium]MCE7889466.1 serine/threonine protein kinase [Sorangiineae bacterium PRO1]MCL4751955.1 serine/threonine protein kinase [Myxococcales bacterium]
MQLAGAVIGGDFRVERELARGGMGGVWLAEQISTGQKRALKIMHPTLIAQARMRERFEQEARVGARIPSEHVVEVIAAGVDSALGIPWLAMELLHGEDLGQLCARRGTLGAQEIVPIFRQLCHALAAAHSVGIVHRDVKPENIFLAEVHSAETTRQLKVLDFGIAKLAAEAKESGTGQVGTPLWMAPEQSDPRAQITPAADVWALGLIAFRLLTGRHYWHAANEPGAALSALFRETLMDVLVPASERAREYGVEHLLPPGFDAWFARTVAREPGQRFPEAHAAFVAFEAMLNGTLPSLPVPTPALASGSMPGISASHPVSASALPPRRASKAPLLILLGAGLLLVGGVAIVAVGAGAWLYTSESPSESSAAQAGAATPADPAPTGATASPAEPTLGTSSASNAKSPRSTTATKTTPVVGDKVPAAEPSPTPTEAPAPAPTPAPSAASSGELKPIDVAAVQKKVSSAAAAAAVACAPNKTPGAASETYTGSCGFRPDGSGTGSMSGSGGAQACVQGKMLSIRIGKYAHPQEWHVETFPWTVTVK